MSEIQRVHNFSWSCDELRRGGYTLYRTFVILVSYALDHNGHLGFFSWPKALMESCAAASSKGSTLQLR